MNQSFQVLTSYASLIEKKIVIQTNGYVDKEKENEFDIIIIEKSSNAKIPFFIEYDKKNIVLKLNEYPNVNTEYLVSINKLINIVGDNIKTSYLKKIIFKSSILSDVKIVSPEMHERCKDLTIELEEYFRDEKLHDFINNFEIEISKDNSFSNIVKTITTEDTLFNVSSIENDQYYLRARVMKDNNVSNWCKTITFEIANENKKHEIIEDDKPILILEDFVLTEKPEQNKTCKSFIFKFNYDVDIDSVEDNVTIYKKDVR